MSNSTHGPLRGQGMPFVMHLERVCRLVEMGQKLMIEFNPCSDVVELMGSMIEGARISILSEGRVCIQRPSGCGAAVANLSLANYKKVWRCWQNGTPTEAQRRAVKWG